MLWHISRSSDNVTMTLQWLAPHCDPRRTTLLTHIIATHMRTGFTGCVVSQNTAAGGKKVRERLYGYNTTSLGIQRQTRDCGVLT